MAYSMVGHLLARRVPQILGLYLGASWVIVEFVSLLVDRFTLSPHLIEFCLVVLGGLIPTVVLLAYFHGAPGRNDWTAAEKIGIPLNLLMAGVLVVVIFNDRPLGAATTRLVMENEQGQTVERVVPKSEFRKKLLVFNFANQSGDTAYDWVQYGLPLGLLFDLYQDIYVDLNGIKGLQERLERAGYPEGVGLPVSLMATLARQLHRDYFVTGSFGERDGQLELTTQLYETRRQKLLAENTFVGTDIFGLADDVSVQVRRDLEIPDRHIEETADLNVGDMLTNSAEAARLQMMAYHEVIVGKDWAAARSSLERAAELDPTSAFGFFQLSVAYLLSNEKGKADSVARLAMEHMYRLPERWQYDFKYYYYDHIEPDPDKRFAVAKMMVELFPADIDGRVLLAQEYQAQNQRGAAIAEYEHILELDPSQHDYLRVIGYLHRDQGEFDKSLAYLQRYAEAVPNDYTAFDGMGDLYRSMGEHERARFYYERALIIEPDNVYVTQDLASTEFNLGNFERAHDLLREALEAARTAQERGAAHARLSAYYQMRGQLDLAVTHKEAEWTEVEAFQPWPVVISEYKLWSLPLYAEAGHADKAFVIMREAELELVQPFNRTIPFGYLGLYLELEDADRAEAAHADAEARMEESGHGWARGYLHVASGRIHELKQEYERAIGSYHEASAFSPTDATIGRYIGRCYRALGQLTEATRQLKASLEITPYNPWGHYELARVHVDAGDADLARQHLRTALDVWSDADPDFKAAQEARDLLAQLEAGTLTS
jgi:tetratricopeptide (TPR) repeat protein/TolB-like protein